MSDDSNYTRAQMRLVEQARDACMTAVRRVQEALTRAVDITGAADAVRQAAQNILSQFEARAAQVEAVVANNIPEHQWDGFAVRLRNPDGGWGAWVTLRGAQGLRGWTPVLAIDVDGVRRVLKITQWTGGEGEPPAQVGYLKSDGTLAVDINDAVTIGYVSEDGPILEINGKTGGTVTLTATDVGAVATVNGMPPDEDGDIDPAVVGDVLLTARTLDPDKWIACDGAVYLQDDWPALYGVLDQVPQFEVFTARTSGFGASAINGLAYGAGKWVAVGASGKIYTSTDQVTWTARTSGFSSSTIYGVFWDGSQFVAVGAGGKLNTSADGETWGTLQTLSGIFTSGDIRCVIKAAGLWLVAGDGGKIATSADATDGSWTAQTSGSSQNLRFVAFGAGTFVVGDAGGKVITSADAITWTAAVTVTSGGNPISGLAFGAGVFVAISWVGGVYSSPDAVTWTDRKTAAGFGSNSVTALAFGDGFFVAGGSTTGRIAYSRDGAVWDAAPTGGLPSTSVSHTSALIAGDAVMLGGGAGHLWTSVLDYDALTEFLAPDIASPAAERGLAYYIRGA